MTTEEFSVFVPTVQTGHIRVARAYPSLYYFELSHNFEVKAKRYAVPVLDKSGKVRVLQGASAEEAIRLFRNAHLRVGKLDRKTAAGLLKESHGLIRPEVWGVSKFIDLGEFDPAEEDERAFVRNMERMLRSMTG